MPRTADDAAVVLDRASGVTAAVREFVRGALATATHHVFIGVAILAVTMVAAVLLMPRRSAPLEFD